LREVAREALAISRAGLARRARLDAHGADEGRHLDILARRVETGRLAAHELLDHYHGDWQGHVEPAFKACRV
jgi:glutamate--cysteine ligase